MQGRAQRRVLALAPGWRLGPAPYPCPTPPHIVYLLLADRVELARHIPRARAGPASPAGPAGPPERGGELGASRTGARDRTRGQARRASSAALLVLAALIRHRRRADPSPPPVAVGRLQDAKPTLDGRIARGIAIHVRTVRDGRRLTERARGAGASRSRGAGRRGARAARSRARAHPVMCQKSIASSCGAPVVEVEQSAQPLAALDRRCDASATQTPVRSDEA